MRIEIIVRVLVLVFRPGGAFAVAACNTIEGLGKDVEKGGANVQDAASGAKEKL